MANLLSTTVNGSLLALNNGVTNAYTTASNGRLYLGSSAQNDYSIYTHMENFGGNYTKLTLDWHTGIKIGASQSYGGIRFYSDAINNGGTKLFSIGEGDGNVRVTNTLYVSGASSRLGNVLVGDGTYKNTIKPIDDSNLNILTPSGAVYFDTFGQASGSFRAPIFYDSNDTNYYLDPNSSGTSLRIAGGIAQNNIVGRPYAVWGSTGTTGAVVIKFPGGTGNYGMIHAVIDIYEYNGNDACTVIVGGHNWNGAWYSYGAQVIGTTNKQVRLGVKDGKYCIVIGDGSSSWSYGQVVLRKIQNGTYYDGIMNVAEGYTAAIESDSYSWISGDLRNLETPSNFYAGGNVYAGGNLVATQSWVSSNFNNYVLPFSYSTGVSANHVVQRDGNGYIYANHINFSTPETENPAISSFITSNGDGWSRKSSLAHVRNQLGNYGNWITTDGRAYPRRSDGTSINFYWSGQSGQPTWLWGSNNGTDFYVWNPSNFSVNYADESGYSASSGSVEWANVQNKPATFPPSTHNHDDRYLVKGGSWYGSGLPGSRWGGFSVSGGEIVFGDGLPNAGQMGILIDGAYLAGENNGFWSLASDNSWSSRRGMYWDGTYLNFTANSAVALFSDILVSSTSNTPINITGGAHKYITINPGNGWEAMVRYIGGSGSSWYVGKRMASQVVGTESFHFYSEAASQTVGGIDTGGNMIVTGSMRAPIFYDSNDTTYYGDFASLSRVNEIGANKMRADTNGTFGTDLGWWSHDPYGQGWGKPHGSFRSLEVSSSGDFSNEPAMFRIHQWGSGAAEFWKPKGTILYLRETPGGGSTWFTKFEVQGSQNITGFLNVNGATEHTANDNGSVVHGTTTNNRVFINGSIQLTNNNDAIVIGRGTATFLTDEELGFGWGGGWYMTEGSYMRSRGNKSLHMNGGSVDYVGSLYLEGSVGVHLQPNSGSYGSLQVTGSKDGWHGIRFTGSNVVVMANGNEVGFHNNNAGWQFRWASGEMYISSGSSGGGTERTVIHSGNIGSQSVSYAGNSGALGGLGVGSFLRDDGWNNFPGQDANTQGTMRSDFTYSNNSPWTGELIRFGASGYSLQLNAAYQSSNMSFRTVNGDNGTYNAWREFIHSGNIASQSVNYADESGYSASSGSVEWTNVNSRPTALSQFTNNLGNYGGWYSASGGTVSGTITLPQNPVGTTYGNGVSATPPFMFAQGAGNDDGIRIYSESAASNQARMVFEIVDDIEEAYTDQWVFRNKRTYSDFIARNEFQVSGSGDAQARSSMRAPIFYDSNDTGYYLDLNSTSNLFQLTTATRARWNMPRTWYDRSGKTSDENYWTGTNGWGTSDGNWDGAWRGGFSGWDIWGTGTGHPQGGGYVHAQGIVSGQHLATSDGSSGYGWMMVGAADAVTNRYWLRGKWGTTTSAWTEIMTSNQNTYAWNMDQWVRTTDSVSFAATTSPTFLVNSHSDNTKGYRIHNTSNSSVSAMFVNSSNQLVIAAGAVDQINLNKKVLVNGVALGVNVAPSATAGRIDASNDIVAYSSSDERLKHNITPIENALDKVKSLTGVEFDWKPEYKHAHGYEGHDTGIIAQQVQEVIPSAVRTNDTGFLAVRYEKLIGLLIEANKELAARVEELEKKLG